MEQSPILIFPASGLSKKFKHLKSVDLPVPDGPIIAIVSHFEISKFISFNTSVFEKLFFKPSIFIILFPFLF